MSVQWKADVSCLASQMKSPEKTAEFFQKQALELQAQTEWRDWFALPFILVPEQNPSFSPYFSRQWADTFLVSLHNFLSVLFQCMHIQTLSIMGCSVVWIALMWHSMYRFEMCFHCNEIRLIELLNSVTSACALELRQWSTANQSCAGGERGVQTDGEDFPLQSFRRFNNAS